MSLIESRLMEDMKTSMKNKEKERLSVVKMLLAEIKNAKVNEEGGRDREWSDTECYDIIGAYHKKIAKAVEEYPEDRRAPFYVELKMIEEYMPKQLSLDDLKNIITKIINESEDKTFGSLMKICSAQLKGQAQGKDISQVLKAVLG